LEYIGVSADGEVEDDAITISALAAVFDPHFERYVIDGWFRSLPQSDKTVPWAT
jgi:hypothetical protein